jgi:hypothetical protein
VHPTRPNNSAGIAVNNKRVFFIGIQSIIRDEQRARRKEERAKSKEAPPPFFPVSATLTTEVMKWLLK